AWILPTDVGGQEPRGGGAPRWVRKGRRGMSQTTVCERCGSRAEGPPPGVCPVCLTAPVEERTLADLLREGADTDRLLAAGEGAARDGRVAGAGGAGEARGRAPGRGVAHGALTPACVAVDRFGGVRVTGWEAAGAEGDGAPGGDGPATWVSTGEPDEEYAEL